MIVTKFLIAQNRNYRRSYRSPASILLYIFYYKKECWKPFFRTQLKNTSSVNHEASLAFVLNEFLRTCRIVYDLITPTIILRVTSYNIICRYFYTYDGIAQISRRHTNSERNAPNGVINTL